MPKVSIVVPVYNVEKYLSKCLNCLVNQTLDDFEVIVVNDGSPDNSQSIIDSYAEKYPDIIKPFIKENGGLSDARNFGVKKACGEYIAFADSDDYMDFDMYELMYQKAVETSADVVFCAYSNVIDDTVYKNFYGASMAFFGESVMRSPKILRYANSYAWNKIYRKAFWDKHNFEFPINQWFEDSAVVYNILGLANKVECVNIPFYYYVKSRNNSITNTVDERIFDIFKSLKSIIDFYKDFPQTDDLKEEINYLCLRHSLARVFKLNEFKNKKLAGKFINRCYEFYDENLPNWRTSSYVCAPKTAKKSTKRLCFIKRHKNIARLYFMGKLWRGTENLFNKIFKKRKTDLETVNQNKRDAIQKYGISVMWFVQKLLKQLDIVSFADFGTLLGIIREGKLLAHDLDMDIGVIIKDKTDLEKIRLHLEKHGFRLWRQYIFGEAENIVEESYHFSGIKVDLNYYRITETQSKTWLFYRDPQKKYPDNTRNIVEMIYSPITEFKTVKVGGEDICIPANAEQLLAEKYGECWKIPDTGWIYWLSPAAHKINDIGYYITYRYKKAADVNEEWFEKFNSDKLVQNRRYQLKQLEVLKCISDICQKHNIQFSLAKSTLKFARQYHKLASWEANLFIYMTSENYDRFLQIAKDELSESEFVLQHNSTVEKYWSANAVVRMKDSEFYQRKLKKVTEDNGPCVHILPLYPVPELYSKKQKRDALKFKFYRKALLLKSRVEKPSSVIEKLIRKYAKLRSYENLHKEVEKIYNMYDANNCDYLVCLSDSTDIKRTTYPKEWFTTTDLVQFEDMFMPVSAQSDEILKTRYGVNYFKCTPLKNRVIGKGVAFKN